jgi:GT2 family glycosyltransferase
MTGESDIDAEPRKHIAVVLPKNRVWVWHEKIISVLQRSFEVDVYSSGDAPPYPRSIEFWLRLERCILGEFDLVKLARVPAAPWRECVDVAVYSLILNLSEQPIFGSDIPILEPRYQGNSDSVNLFAALFVRQNPYLSFHLKEHEEPIVASYLANPDRIVLARVLQNSFARLIALAERATKHLIHGTSAAILPRPPNSSPVFSSAIMARFCLRFGLDKAFWSFVRRLQIKEYWSIALSQLENSDVTRKPAVEKLVILPDDGRRYYADPFLFADAGRRWLFFEELEYRTGKGIISCAQVKDERRISAPIPVLKRPYHLSYPFVFRQGSEIYMIPETGSNNTVELYRAQSFPFSWMLHLTLLENVALYDATLLQYQNRLWLFGAVSHYASPPQDELAIFYSESLEGPWHPHRLNPVKSDCRSSRPAGRVVVRDNRLLRPAQDCESGYGSALVWCEIIELTPDRYHERELSRWYAHDLNAAGIHTFDCDDGLSVIDIKHTVWKRSILTRKWDKTTALSDTRSSRCPRSGGIREISVNKEPARAPMILDDIGVVVIGRNEGKRLIDCLASVKLETNNNVVYVDSGSTDGSTAAAQEFGAFVVNLDLTQPFSAARARNEGFRVLKVLKPDIRFVQFLDGDCILIQGWLDTATAFIKQQPDVAIVSGRLRELHPTASIYNQLCDIEWDAPIGEISACGGNSMVRVEAFEAAGGFLPQLIGGEEPELCLRLRERGWKIWRLSADMARHDAAMTRFSQWWGRSVRSGYGLADIWLLHWTSPLWSWDMASSVFWGGLLPATICLGALIHPAALGGALAYFLQVCRIAFARGLTSSQSWIFAIVIMVSKFAYFQGILKFCWRQLCRRGAPLIEYK